MDQFLSVSITLVVSIAIFILAGIVIKKKDFPNNKKQ